MKKLANQIMLITYPDSLGGNLSMLSQALRTHFEGAVGSLHILPFFPSSGDRGFSPITYEQVAPAFGTWEAVEALSRDYPIMCDMMVNHISRRSREFQDYLKNGEQSEYASMFFDYEQFFGGEPSKEELTKLYRRSEKPLYVSITLNNGQEKKLWCSFSSEQIDLDVNSPAAREYIMHNLKALGSHGISVVRMDAYGYITKVRGTNCFFVRPQVWELIHDMEALLEKQNMTLLPEVHDRYETALEISAQGYYTYDFVLPLLVLHTLYSGKATELKRWLSLCPRDQFTVLDTHDGIGVFDADGIVSKPQADAVIRQIEPNLSYRYQPMDESKKKYYQSYQLYGTYYSLLNEDDNAYLLARAIQFFAPGIPQVYYVGMLAGKNDLSFDAADHRFINRRNYSLSELAQECERPVVQRLLRLMRLRNSHPAFAGELQIAATADDQLCLKRMVGKAFVTLCANLSNQHFQILYTEDGETKVF